MTPLAALRPVISRQLVNRVTGAVVHTYPNTEDATRRAMRTANRLNSLCGPGTYAVRRTLGA